jgi:uncharacterized membrane protein
MLLVASLLGLAVVVSPILSVIGFLRARAMRAELARLTAEVESLQSRFWTLSKRVSESEQPATSRPDAAPAPAAAQAPATPAAPAAPVAPAAPAAPAAPVAPVSPPVSAAVAPPPIPTAPAPVAPRVPASPVAPLPPVAAGPAPGFDWESMLGVRGAAWLGGVTLVIAALFFARWSIEQGFFSPVIRVALLLLAGTAALLWAELKLRDGYPTTANAVSGAGVVVLYAAFFAAHALYQLVSLSVAFAGMAIVTLLAGLIAVRFAAQFTALIGLAGGLATPVLLSSGVDRPVAFFSYLALLAAGFVHVAERRRWPAVTALALAGTTTLQLAWYATSMDSGELLIGTAAFTTIGAVYLWHAVRSRRLDRPLLHNAGLIGALVPLAFAMLLAGSGSFDEQWYGVLTFLAVVDAGLAAAALAWDLPLLIAVPAAATAVVAWLLGDAYRGITTRPALLPIALIAMAAAYSGIPRLAERWSIDSTTGPRLAVRVSAAAMLAALLGFSWLAIDGERLPLWAFVALVSTMFVIVLDRTRGFEWPGAFPAAVFAIAWVTSHWVVVMSTDASYPDQLTLPHLFATAVAIVAISRGSRRQPRDVAWWKKDHAGTVAAVSIAFLTAFNGIDTGAAATPLPFFLLVGLDVALLLTVAVQMRWSSLVPLAAAGSLLFNAAWHVGYFQATTAAVAIAAYSATYLLFLSWPFVAARRLAAWWKTRPAAWLASALVGPATFPLYHDAWRDLWGTALVGVVPVTMAAASVAALYGVARQFAPSTDAADAKRRLDYLALFASIALGFIATAVPLQLDRQWITIGWALEAAAVWWLFGLLPHPGLKYFGLTLYLAVAMRLLANPEVLHYQPRGAPVFNWLLYTYGVPALCCLVGAYLIGVAERRRGPTPSYDVLARDREAPGPAVGFIGVLLVFWLINLEIADYYSVGRYVEVDLSRHLARDLTRSCAWGLYALVLLGAGLWRGNRALRLVSLGFLLLTVGKVFLYDLGQLDGLYRIMSFLALGLSLIVVSLLYQRFVARSEATA